MNYRNDIPGKVHQDLAGRSLNGTWAQLLGYLIILLTTDCAARAPWVAWTGAALLGTVTVLRLILIRRFDSLYPRNPRLWYYASLPLIMFSAFFWGAAASLATKYFDLREPAVLIILLAHAAMGLGTVNLLVHDLRSMNVALTLLYGPLLFVETLFVADSWHGPALMTIAYLIYLVFQGRQLGEAYSQQVKDNDDLATIARRDFLTQLPNRLGMQEILDRAVGDAGEGSRLIALLYIDLDGFKQINDRYSHRAGDLLLREVAKRLSGSVEPAGVAARLGGDEFAVLVADCPDRETASRIAESVLQLMREPIPFEGQSVACSASVGVSFYPQDAETSDLLIRAADKAMYAAKASGKGRVCLFDEPDRSLRAGA